MMLVMDGWERRWVRRVLPIRPVAPVRITFIGGEIWRKGSVMRFDKENELENVL